MKPRLSIGTIEVIVGPMFAGKTSELIRRIVRESYAKKKVGIFKPSIDVRYSIENVVSHNGLSYPAFVVPTNKNGIWKIYELAKENGLDVVGIDEAHFFPTELVSVCEKLADEGVRVIVAGLNLDFRGEPFETVKELLARADDITYLTAVCTVCGSPATRTQRLIDGKPAPYDSPRIVVGGKELYEARCRKHHVVPGKP
ncbi:MAG: thymidine kinase [Thermoprotei archaeon]|nr:MAG: thymidine kinase [Thermoprotei archaeon]